MKTYHVDKLQQMNIGYIGYYIIEYKCDDLTNDALYNGYNKNKII